MQMCKKGLMLGLALALLGWTAAQAVPYQDGVYRDKAAGYNDEVIVTVTVRDGKIDSLTAENKSGGESEYFKKAEAGLSKAIVEKQGVNGVDSVAGATGTSASILEAMQGILQQAQYAGAGGGGSATGGDAALPLVDAEQSLGLGSTVTFRTGPGKDASGAQVYSFNVAMAAVLFDREGRILGADIDVYEILSPNAKDGPKFSGWPADEDSAKALTGELSAWQTKRGRGDSYGMNPANEWYRQMDAYERFMAGKTTKELRDWFTRHTSPKNGRPLKPDMTDAEEQKAYTALTEAEKADLADVTAAATMSLSDAHGLILEAVEAAYENRQGIR